MANFDTFETTLEEPDKNFISKLGQIENGVAVLASKYRCEGLTEESLKPVFENSMDLLRGLNNRMEPE